MRILRLVFGRYEIKAKNGDRMANGDTPLELPSWLMAGIRTMVQGAVGFVVTWLAAKNITLDSVAIEGIFFAVTTGAVAALLRVAEKKFPWVTRVLSIGFSGAKPVYMATDDIPKAVAVIDDLTQAKAA